MVGGEEQEPIAAVARLGAIVADEVVDGGESGAGFFFGIPAFTR